ncbi:MAG: hypothetical protein JOZ24_07175, partial [Candidatus Eremiobacteraeota bacterium]|nr:hypothetical protein [Candidatus Eremiobacteraeota bacterium]
KNGSAAKRFADAILEAARWANAHRAESAKILEKHSRADAAVVGRMRRATYGERFDPKSLQAVIDTAVRFKFLKQSFPAQDLIDANL